MCWKCNSVNVSILFHDQVVKVVYIFFLKRYFKKNMRTRQTENSRGSCQQNGITVLEMRK